MNSHPPFQAEIDEAGHVTCLRPRPSSRDLPGGHRGLDRAGADQS